MKVPAGFMLMSRQIKVEFERIGENAYGQFDYGAAKISISPDVNDGLAFAIFCHELTHAILQTLSYHKLRENEKFVDRFGSLLAQALQSAREPDA